MSLHSSLLIADSTLLRLADKINPDLLGVMGLVSAVLFFGLLIISVVTISRTLQNIAMARMQNNMINELLAKGYSVDEIQQLVTGTRRSVLTRFFDRSRQTYVNRRPSPPVKSNV